MFLVQKTKPRISLVEMKHVNIDKRYMYIVAQSGIQNIDTLTQR